MDSLPKLLTPGRIATELGESVRRVQYILATRPTIKPTALAGNVRLYDSESMAAIANELTAIDSRRSAQESASCS